jgi:hypothetical protein
MNNRTKVPSTIISQSPPVKFIHCLINIMIPSFDFDHILCICISIYLMHISYVRIQSMSVLTKYCVNFQVFHLVCENKPTPNINQASTYSTLRGHESYGNNNNILLKIYNASGQRVLNSNTRKVRKNDYQPQEGNLAASRGTARKRPSSKPL